MNITEKMYTDSFDDFNVKLKDKTLNFSFVSDGYVYGIINSKGMCLLAQDGLDVKEYLFDCHVDVVPVKCRLFVEMYNKIIFGCMKKKIIDVPNTDLEFSVKDDVKYSFGPFRAVYDSEYHLQYHVNDFFGDRWIDVNVPEELKRKMDDKCIEETGLNVKEAIEDPFTEVHKQY